MVTIYPFSLVHFPLKKTGVGFMGFPSMLLALQHLTGHGSVGPRRSLLSMRTVSSSSATALVRLGLSRRLRWLALRPPTSASHKWMLGRRGGCWGTCFVFLFGLELVCFCFHFWRVLGLVLFGILLGGGGWWILGQWSSGRILFISSTNASPFFPASQTWAL